MHSRLWKPFIFITLLLGACRPGAGSTPTSTQPVPTITPIAESTGQTTSELISGIVMGEIGPLPGAIIRVQATELMAISTEDGSFSLSLEGWDDETYNLTGWAPGYFCSGPFSAEPGEHDVIIELNKHADDDNPDYKWLPSRFYPGQGENQGCAECHSRAGTDLPFSLPVDEWLLDAHSQSATNPRFLTMYNGTDMEGNQSPVTRKG